MIALSLFAYFSVVAAAAWSTVSGQVNDTEHHLLFRKFTTDHKKSYSSQEEYDLRFRVFQSTLQHIQERNSAEIAAGGSAVHGINKFADRSTEEMFPAEFDIRSLIPLDISAHKSEYKLMATARTTSDWRSSFVTPVKYQGECDSCYAFVAVEQIESDAIRLLNLPAGTSLSTQQLISCSNNQGCHSGWIGSAFDYVASNGLESDSSYPYTSGNAAVSGSCQRDSSREMISLKSYHFLPAGDEPAIANYVLTTGPLAVLMAGNSLMTYHSGHMPLAAIYHF